MSLHPTPYPTLPTPRRCIRTLVGNVFALLLLFGPAAFGQEAPKPTPPGAPNAEVRWNARIEVLMVALPDATFLELLPELRDPDMIEGAVTKLLELIKNGKATLTGYPIIHTISGQRAVSESITEKRYPTEFELPQIPHDADSAPAAAQAKAKHNDDGAKLVPTKFETRNVGVILEAEAIVTPDGKVIHLNMVPQRVELLGFDEYESGSLKGTRVFANQPCFYTTKVTSSMTVGNGKRVLIGAHRLVNPEGHTEVFVLQACATRED